MNTLSGHLSNDQHFWCKGGADSVNAGCYPARQHPGLQGACITVAVKACHLDCCLFLGSSAEGLFKGWVRNGGPCAAVLSEHFFVLTHHCGSVDGVVCDDSVGMDEEISDTCLHQCSHC